KVRDGQIWLPIAVEVARSQGHGTTARSDGQWLLEGPIPVAQQHLDIARTASERGPTVGHSEVGHPVAIEVAHDDGRTTSSCGDDGPCRLEGPIVLAKQHFDSTSAQIEVELVRHGES